MFQQWIKNFQQTRTSNEPDRQSVERLTALLLIEVARSDTTIEDAELTSIRQALKSASGSIDDDEIDDLINTAIQDANMAVSLHTQLRQINKEFTLEQKLSLIEQMWVVALADGDLDKYEEHMIRTLCGLLRLSHEDFIQAKLKVIDA